MIVVACIALVCVALLIGLVLVLRHLAAMRATDGEIAALQEMEHNRTDMTSKALGAVRERIEDLDKRLVHLNNRTQR